MYELIRIFSYNLLAPHWCLGLEVGLGYKSHCINSYKTGQFSHEIKWYLVHTVLFILCVLSWYCLFYWESILNDSAREWSERLWLISHHIAKTFGHFTEKKELTTVCTAVGATEEANPCQCEGINKDYVIYSIHIYLFCLKYCIILQYM